MLVVAAPAFAGPKTIVGQWRYANDPNCWPSAGAITIGPKHIGWDDASCRFDTVRRDGSRVTWQGHCSSVDEAAERTTVSATETKDGRLFLVFNGGRPDGPYLRCGR